VSASEIRPARQEDISEIIELQAIVWQDHFLRERNMQVPIMRRTHKNMNYYLKKEQAGCLVALDGKKIVGTVISHVWGSVGWFGPLEVDPRYQDKGIGKALVAESVNYLRSRGCSTIGCETMASSARNLAFYHKLGFKSKSLSHVFYKVLTDIPPEAMDNTQSRQFQSNESMSEYKNIWNRILPGLDYSVEFNSLLADDLGQIMVIDSADGPAHAIVHTHEMFEESSNAILKLLIAGSTEIADMLLESCEISALVNGKVGMFIRSCDATPPDLGWFFKHGYVLQSASVRLILEGQDETGQINHVSCWSG
jgi:ribosomal protein S18 acetylase RimI-like enzyme